MRIQVIILSEFKYLPHIRRWSIKYFPLIHSRHGTMQWKEKKLAGIPKEIIYFQFFKNFRYFIPTSKKYKNCSSPFRTADMLNCSLNLHVAKKMERHVTMIGTKKIDGYISSVEIKELPFKTLKLINFTTQAH